MNLPDWQARAIELFGKDPNDWRFVCPACGKVQGRHDFLDLGMSDQQTENSLAYACVMRWIDQSCMFAAEGPVTLYVTPEEPRPTFEFHEETDDSEPC